jgi:ABC-type bacteriocin/lantibiotic exporter with double-glycine peptidase domain
VLLLPNHAATCQDTQQHSKRFEYILAGSTRVLVTHQRQYLPACDRLLVLRHGRVAAAGTFAELADLGLSELHNPAGAQRTDGAICRL